MDTPNFLGGCQRWRPLLGRPFFAPVKACNGYAPILVLMVQGLSSNIHHTILFADPRFFHAHDQLLFGWRQRLHVVVDVLNLW